jgi:hypothetical protein
MLFDKEPVDDVSELLRRFPRRALASPFRSTVPLPALLKDAQVAAEIVPLQISL